MNSAGIDQRFFEQDDYGGFVFHVRELWNRRHQFTVAFDNPGHATVATPSMDVATDPPKAVA